MMSLHGVHLEAMKEDQSQTLKNALSETETELIYFEVEKTGLPTKEYRQ